MEVVGEVIALYTPLSRERESEMNSKSYGFPVFLFPFKHNYPLLL